MRLKGGDVTVFTLGSASLVGELNECTFQSTVGDEDGSGINEVSEDPEPVSRARQITGTAFAEDVPAFMVLIESANPVVTFAFSDGGLSYTGNGLLTQVEVQTRRKALHQERFTIKVKGTPTIVEAA